LDPSLRDAGAEYHAACWPDHLPLLDTGITPYDMGVREELIQVIQWADRNSERSKQVGLGASEVGMDCTRRLAYRMAGIPGLHRRMDGWPAIVGTSIHSWVEKAVNRFQAAHPGELSWVTEMQVLPNPLIMGHTDLYESKRGLVLDWKFPSTDNLKKLIKDGWSQQYRIQAHLYGLGHKNAGRKVERVGIIAIARQGSLRSVHCKTEPFDESVAQWAVDRVYELGNFLIANEVEKHPDIFADIPAVPSRLCGYCPWFRSNSLSEASDKGCPGA
jgi:hypothetical protein